MKLALRILLHLFTCIIFILGKLFIDLTADFNESPYSIGNNTYYVWDKLCFLLITLCVIYPCRKLAWLFYVMGGLMFVRLMDEMPIVRDWQWWVNSHGMVWVDMLSFIALLGFVYYHAGKEIKKAQQYSKLYKPQEEQKPINTKQFKLWTF